MSLSSTNNGQLLFNPTLYLDLRFVMGKGVDKCPLRKRLSSITKWGWCKETWLKWMKILVICLLIWTIGATISVSRWETGALISVNKSEPRLEALVLTPEILALLLQPDPQEPHMVNHSTKDQSKTKEWRNWTDLASHFATNLNQTTDLPLTTCLLLNLLDHHSLHSGSKILCDQISMYPN